MIAQLYTIKCMQHITSYRPLTNVAIYTIHVRQVRLNELNLNKLVSIIYIIISFVQNAKTKKKY